MPRQWIFETTECSAFFSPFLFHPRKYYSLSTASVIRKSHICCKQCAWSIWIIHVYMFGSRLGILLVIMPFGFWRKKQTKTAEKKSGDKLMYRNVVYVRDCWRISNQPHLPTVNCYNVLNGWHEIDAASDLQQAKPKRWIRANPKHSPKWLNWGEIFAVLVESMCRWCVTSAVKNNDNESIEYFIIVIQSFSIDRIVNWKIIWLLSKATIHYDPLFGWRHTNWSGKTAGYWFFFNKHSSKMSITDMNQMQKW